MEENGTFDLLPKKEVAGLKKEYDKLNKLLCGIRSMDRLPQAMFIVDPQKEDIAIREARRLNIPVFGIVDTNCDPDAVDYVIPANDDAIRAVKLITGVMANAIVEANGGKIVDYVSGKTEENGQDIMKRAVESVKRKEERKPNNKPFDKNRRFNKENNEVKDVNKTEKVETKEKVEKTVKTEKVEKEVKKAAVEDLTGKTVSELRELAKAKEVKGYSTMKKAELLEALK